ncbi:SPRYD3 isoform 3 [Pan troglodytes]|uniref:SPRYD3 isoform 3 n=1 Tax=Pan troglodytes TaxID=9598 RepID=A0A2J8KDA1_PANTR|nr:SPRYD3 isoform 3 [Pan troglodytes]
MRRTRRPRFVLMNKMDDLNLHYRFLNWRRRIREIREVRAFRYQERFKHILVDGDTLSYHGNSGEVGCYVASRPLTKDSNYFEVSIVDSGVRGTIAVGLVPQYYSLDHQPGWLPDSVAYHADDGKWALPSCPCPQMDCSQQWACTPWVRRCGCTSTLSWAARTTAS